MNILNVKKLNSPIDGKLSSYLVITDNNKIQLTVPIAEANTDYQNILQWVEDGNTIQEAD
jgi:hypothetical protein